MSTARASTPRVHRTPRGILQSLFVSVGLAGALGVSWLGCSFGWDDYDPRLGGGGAASTGMGGSGPTTGMGGAASSSVTDSAASSSGMGDAVSSSGPGGAASSSSSGGTGGTGGGPTHCGGTSVLADDFPGGDPGELWDHYGDNTTASETGGEAVIALPNNSPNGSWGEFDTQRGYDLRGDSISIEVKSTSNPSTNAQTWFGVGFEDNFLQIYQQNGVLHFEQQVAGSTTSLKTTAYNPLVHRHWRFRDDGQTTHWETSSDGASWTSMAQVATATLFPLDLVWIWFGGGTNGGEANPGEVHIDRVNGGGTPKEKWCPVSSFKDDFNDGARSLAWDRYWEDDPDMLAEMGGRLVIKLVPNSTGSASYVAASAFDLTESAVLIEVPSVVGTADGSKTQIALGAPGDRGIEMSESQGQLHFNINSPNNNQEIGSLLYSPVKHRWWRIRESANTLFWETAPDGKTWQVQAQLSPVPLPIEALDLYVGSGTWTEQPSPGVSSFDNLNLPPP
jgi:hypothetical protein